MVEESLPSRDEPADQMCTKQQSQLQALILLWDLEHVRSSPGDLVQALGNQLQRPKHRQHSCILFVLQRYLQLTRLDGVPRCHGKVGISTRPGAHRTDAQGCSHLTVGLPANFRPAPQQDTPAAFLFRDGHHLVAELPHIDALV